MRGFTLVEVLVALVLFSLGVIALMSAQSTTLRTQAALEGQTLATIVAENRLVEVLGDIRPPDLGVARGNEVIGGVEYEWRQNVSAAGVVDVVRVDISVSRRGDPREIAAISGFRGAR
ncbi:MAG: type II secretion system minor pseudopilin GspI [Pseudomonadota bacterium]